MKKSFLLTVITSLLIVSSLLIAFAGIAKNTPEQTITTSEAALSDAFIDTEYFTDDQTTNSDTGEAVSSTHAYWCAGKNKTCLNKTDSESDIYCDECDPDCDNKENKHSEHHSNNFSGSYTDSVSYHCKGKNDTCTNKTDSEYDVYCDECDPDCDNKENKHSSNHSGHH